jgi:phosphoglycolate phosphatase-like HAD superfamily hydrolase
VACAPLGAVTHVFTDLDGTLFAPGGTLLANHAGESCVALAQALCNLKAAGIEVIIVTGRNSSQGMEMLRVLNLDTFVGEMGATVETCDRSQAGKPQSRLRYLLGAWDADVAKDCAPAQLVAQSGVVEQLLAAFPGQLELYPNMNMAASTVLRGAIDIEKANRLLATELAMRPPATAGETHAMAQATAKALPLTLHDNGIIHTPAPGLPTLSELHIYHLLPSGVSKAAAVAALMTERGIAPKAAVAIGDSAADMAMGEHTGTLVVMQNGLKSGGVRAALSRRQAALDQATPLVGANKAADVSQAVNAVEPDESPFFSTTFCTLKPTADGWVEFAEALLAAKRTGGAQAEAEHRG